MAGPFDGFDKLTAGPAQGKPLDLAQGEQVGTAARLPGRSSGFRCGWIPSSDLGIQPYNTVALGLQGGANYSGWRDGGGVW
ncbi:MAG: hypothetical protein ABSA12_12805 [Verrucomicrobiia bacterium]